MSCCFGAQPSTEELRFLLKWAFGDVEASRSKVAPFNLLKAVITRRLVVPEVYDLMDRVQELMIKAHVRPFLPHTQQLPTPLYQSKHST